MKVNELRVGNWVQGYWQYNDGRRKVDMPMQVDTISTGDIYCEFEGNQGDAWEYNEGEFEGVPLTCEIAQSCGVIKDINLQGISTEQIASVGFPYYHNGMLIKRLKHVHELQNLHFAITGEELTIKL